MSVIFTEVLPFLLRSSLMTLVIISPTPVIYVVSRSEWGRWFPSDARVRRQVRIAVAGERLPEDGQMGGELGLSEAPCSCQLTGVVGCTGHQSDVLHDPTAGTHG